MESVTCLTKRLKLLVYKFMINSFNQTHNHVYACSHVHSSYKHDNLMLLNYVYGHALIDHGKDSFLNLFQNP